ncbi:MAG: hypothetical protein ACXWBS_07315, partial [Chthoniobacterales bacterium]
MIRRALIYGLLLLGTIIFAWPFLWMAATTAKLDRELFAGNRLFPERPIPRAHSPYVDDRFFTDVSGPRTTEALTIIEQRLASANYPWPADLDRAVLQKEVARGIYQKLLNVLPAETWKLPNEQLSSSITAVIDDNLMVETAAQLRRVFCIGQLLARSYDL